MDAIAKIPTYEAYTDSDNDYSGKVPIDWGLVPIRAIFEERNEKNDGPVTEHILSVTRDRGVIPYDEKGAIGNNKSEDIERYKLVYENDLVINKMNVVIGSLGLSKYFGALSQVYIVLRPKSNRFSIRYYAYMFHNEPFYKSLIRYCTGIMELRESLNKDQFKQLYLPFPSLEEQTLIANFLDKQTTKIDEAIAIKEQQIALLKERKQIIIQKAVTQGLDPNAPMKDSGVDWIGEMPAHWEVKKLKYMVRFYGGGTPSKDNKDYWGGDISWVSPKDMKMPFISSSIDTITELAVKKSSVKLIEEGAILIVVRGMILAKKIPVAIATKKLTINQDMKALVVSDGSLPVFLMCLLDGLHETLSTLLEESGHGTKTLPTEKLGSLNLPIPPFREQEKIVNFIEDQTVFFERSIEIQKEQIEKLKEYKTTLINSAVTGKIKVTPEMVGLECNSQDAVEA
ncbi:MAG: restriction endonuclease subunit S [Pseudomonadales bacterium]|nr:restriction endonuclease subunit S [Pseudomonadales bacterium]MBP77576.1 restriction endonuclease subunit S [Pseudomonadales bacterium]|tara:strand:- start:8824 stop:10188 length:1365 start_codon:yes stop_codon:yes gene_type:complete